MNSETNQTVFKGPLVEGVSHMHGVSQDDQTTHPNERRLPYTYLGAVFIILAGLIFASLYLDRQRTISEINRNLSHISTVLAERVEGLFRDADLRISSLQDTLAEADLISEAQIEADYGAILRDALNDLDAIDNMIIISADGTALWGGRLGVAGLQLADRIYFQRALNEPGMGLQAGEPINSRLNGRRFTPIAWPIRGPDGEVRGVIASSLYADYFLRLFDESTHIDDTEIRILTSTDQVVFARHGYAGDTSLQDETLYRQGAIDLAELYENAFVQTHIVEGSQLLTVASMQVEAALRDYNERSLWFIAIVMVLFAVAGITGTIAVRQKAEISSALRGAKREAQRATYAKREFEAIVGDVQDGIVMFDHDRTFQRVNTTARKILMAESDVEGIDRLLQLFPQILDAELGNYFTLKQDMQTDESERSLNCAVNRLSREDQIFYYCVLSDVTETERLARARSTFIASVNHELRTPLTSLKGSLALLSNLYAEKLDAGAQELIELCSRNAERLLFIVNDILTIQAIEQGGLILDVKPCQIAPLLKEAVAINMGYVGNLEVSLVLQEPMPEARVEVDPMRFHQIMSNLISNAAKYSPKAESVSVSATVSLEHIKICVSDKGPGIPKQFRHRLFKRFAGPAQNNTVQASGAGLGLAITRELVERQNGRIELKTYTQNGPDKNGETGSTFSIIFPLI